MTLEQGCESCITERNARCYHARPSRNRLEEGTWKGGGLNAHANATGTSRRHGGLLFPASRGQRGNEETLRLTGSDSSMCLAKLPANSSPPQLDAMVSSN
eukprot:767263-Hanusia_phi.AAC.10